MHKSNVARRIEPHFFKSTENADHFLNVEISTCILYVFSARPIQVGRTPQLLSDLGLWRLLVQKNKPHISEEEPVLLVILIWTFRIISLICFLSISSPIAILVHTEFPREG